MGLSRPDGVSAAARAEKHLGTAVEEIPQPTDRRPPTTGAVPYR